MFLFVCTLLTELSHKQQFSSRYSAARCLTTTLILFKVWWKSLAHKAGAWQFSAISTDPGKVPNMDLWHVLPTGGYLNAVVKSKVRSLQQRSQAGVAS